MNEDQYIHFGDARHAGEWNRLVPIARHVAYVASFLSKTFFSELLSTTSIYRKKTADSGIHEHFRAIDFSPLKNMADTYRLIEMINALFIYDPDRPNLKVAMENPFHGTGCHIHLQVHEKTTHITNQQMVDFLARAGHDKSNFHPVKLT